MANGPFFTGAIPAPFGRFLEGIGALGNLAAGL